MAVATRDACDAARSVYVDVARAHGATVDLGDCREITPEELERLKPIDLRSLPSAH